MTLKIRNRSSLEPLRIDEPRGGDDGLRELLTRPIKSSTRLYDNIESELLREQLLATSAESPAEAFVKRLLNPSPASRSKFEELLRAATAEASLAATATQAKESALENEDLREQLAAAESRAVEAEASLTSFKESAANDAAPQSEVEALREQDESEYAKDLLRRLSECTAPNVQIFTECIAPDVTELRAPPASPTPEAARDRPRGAGGSTTTRSRARSRLRSACSRR